MLRTRRTVEGLLRAYAAILFCKRPAVGFLFLLATFWFPNAGMAGFIGALTGSLTARLLSFPNVSSGLHIYNSLLVGLALGIVFRLDGYLLALILMGAVLAVLLTVAMTDMLWRIDHLPVLSLPFVIVAFTCFFAAQAYGNLSVYLFPAAPVAPFINDWIDGFFIALGSSFFIPHPVAGLLFFIGLLLTSRYLALLAISGFLAGYGVLYWLSGSIHPILGQWGGFNFILSALAVGGIFSVPGWRSFMLAIAAAALSSLVTMAVQGVLQIYGLPVLAIPFLLTTLTVLAAMRKRMATTPPYLLLEEPDLPENSYEQARLARARGAEPESVPLRAPFFGSWQVYQGFNGPHTHQPPWQHALDFIITENGKSFRHQGLLLHDYYCYDLPVLSPCHGTVARCMDRLVDNQPGEVDHKNNWGNFLVIALDSGLYVLLAHLRQHSLTVTEGERLIPGQPVARCGNTGRSPQPHLHLHVQTTPVLGSDTHPFHLLGIALNEKHDQEARFHVASLPVEGDTVSVVKVDAPFQRALHLALGLQLHFRYRLNEGGWHSQCLTVTIDLGGGFRLNSSSGASVSFVEDGGILFFFKRTGGKDNLLDLWLLSLGLTPVLEAPLTWTDRPSDRLLPLNPFWRILRMLFRPMGGGLDSRYTRSKNKGIWHQQGRHELNLFPGVKQMATTDAFVRPDSGCIRFSLTMNGLTLEAELEEISTTADQGIPGSSISLMNNNKE